MVNLLDDLPYRIRSNIGPAILKRFPPGSFLQARVVPVGEEWVLSGTCATYPAHDRDEVYAAAYEIAIRSPAFTMMNPIARERAWERQREDRARFIEFFGSDTVVLDRHEYALQMDAYMLWALRQASAAAGRPGPEELPANLRVELPDGFEDVETVGIIYDEIEGMHILPDFGCLVEAFEDSERFAQDPWRETLLNYLFDPDMHPLPLRRLAEANTQRANAVFRAGLGRPAFAWRRSGEALLRKHKPQWMGKESLPGNSAVSDRLAAFARARLEGTDASER